MIFDPKTFNYCILAMYLLNAANWAYAGSWGNAMYWSGAFWITLSVTIWSVK